MKDQAGWFVWTRSNGRIAYHKYDVLSGTRIHKDSKAYYEGFEVTKFPITHTEWGLSLDQLAVRYPLPQTFIRVEDRLPKSQVEEID